MARIMATARAPSAAPRTMAPPASTATLPRAARGWAAWSVAAIETAAENTTIATPSLNRASPCSTALSVGESLCSRAADRTATGSVGPIRAPNTRAQAGNSSIPNSLAAPQSPPAIRATEKRTPRVASDATVATRRRSSPRSTCIAPAKSRKASM